MLSATLIATAVTLAASVSGAATPTCVTQTSGNLWTVPYYNATTKDLIAKPYTWNSNGYVGFYNDGPNDLISVEWQTCTPNTYNAPAGSPLEEGRFYLPKTKTCLGVLNPSDPKSDYFVGSAACPGSNPDIEGPSYAYGFNFQTQKDENQYWFIGSTKADGSGTQGSAKTGRYYVQGFTEGEPAEPATNRSDVHLVHLVDILPAGTTTALPHNAFAIHS